jgi:hypothetical protein
VHRVAQLPELEQVAGHAPLHRPRIAQDSP